MDRLLNIVQVLRNMEAAGLPAQVVSDFAKLAAQGGGSLNLTPPPGASKELTENAINGIHEIALMLGIPITINLKEPE